MRRDWNRLFAPEMAARNAAQLVIHEGDQAVERRRVDLAPGHEQSGYIVHTEQSVISP